MYEFSLCFLDRSVYDDILKITLKLIKNDVDILLEANEVFHVGQCLGQEKHSIFMKETGALSLIVLIKKMKRKMKNEYS